VAGSPSPVTVGRDINTCRTTANAGILFAFFFIEPYVVLRRF